MRLQILLDAISFGVVSKQSHSYPDAKFMEFFIILVQKVKSSHIQLNLIKTGARKYFHLVKLFQISLVCFL